MYARSHVIIIYEVICLKAWNTDAHPPKAIDIYPLGTLQKMQLLVFQSPIRFFSSLLFT